MRSYLFLSIVMSGMMIFGYPIVDVILLLIFLSLIFLKHTLKIKLDIVFVFCAYMILQVLRGMLLLADIRMFYWIVFFTVVFLSHQFLRHLIINNKVNFNFVQYTFKYSSLYLAIYGALGFFIPNPDDFQGIFWVGSSVAFIIIIPYICSHFILFKASGFTFSGLRIFNIIMLI